MTIDHFSALLTNRTYVLIVATSTPEAALTLPFSFLETGNEKPETRKTNSSKERYPVRPKSQPASAGFTFQPGCLRPGDAGWGERRDHQSRRTRRTKRRPQGAGATFSSARLLDFSPARL